MKRPKVKTLLRGNLKRNLIISAAARIFRPILSGLLYLPEKGDREERGATGIEKIIRNATPEQYAQAIQLYRFIASHLFERVFYKFRLRFDKTVFEAIRK